MNRKIGNSISQNEYMIHPILQVMIPNDNKEKIMPTNPYLNDGVFRYTSKETNERVNLKKLSDFMEKPYIPINSKMILDLKNIKNLIDFETLIKNKEFKTDLEFRYYFNIFMRLNLDILTINQNKILLNLLSNYFLKKNLNNDKELIKKYIEKFKLKNSSNDYDFNFIEYLELKMVKKIKN